MGSALQDSADGWPRALSGTARGSNEWFLDVHGSVSHDRLADGLDLEADLLQRRAVEDEAAVKDEGGLVHLLVDWAQPTPNRTTFCFFPAVRFVRATLVGRGRRAYHAQGHVGSGRAR